VGTGCGGNPPHGVRPSPTRARACEIRGAGAHRRKEGKKEIAMAAREKPPFDQAQGDSTRFRIVACGRTTRPRCQCSVRGRRHIYAHVDRRSRRPGGRRHPTSTKRGKRQGPKTRNVASRRRRGKERRSPNRALQKAFKQVVFTTWRHTIRACWSVKALADAAAKAAWKF